MKVLIRPKDLKLMLKTKTKKEICKALGISHFTLNDYIHMLSTVNEDAADKVVDKFLKDKQHTPEGDVLPVHIDFLLD